MLRKFTVKKNSDGLDFGCGGSTLIFVTKTAFANAGVAVRATFARVFVADGKGVAEFATVAVADGISVGKTIVAVAVGARVGARRSTRVLIAAAVGSDVAVCALGTSVGAISVGMVAELVHAFKKKIAQPIANTVNGFFILFRDTFEIRGLPLSHPS